MHVEKREMATDVRSTTCLCNHSYKDTFKACVRRVLADTDEIQDDKNLEEEEDGAAAGERADDSGVAFFQGRPPTAAEDYAARSVQQAYREFREKRLQVIKGIRRTCMIQVCTVRQREIGTPEIGTILEFASVPLKKIGTRLLGFCWPRQCVLPRLYSEGREWVLRVIGNENPWILYQTKSICTIWEPDLRLSEPR